MVNYKKTDGKKLVRVIDLGEKLMNKIVKKRNIYLLDSFLADSKFIDKLITSTKEVLIINDEVKNILMEIDISYLSELEKVGLVGNSLDIKVSHIIILNKLNNKSKIKLPFKRLFDGIILVLESLAKVFPKLDPFVEIMKLLKNISKNYDDPYLPSYL